MVFEVVFEVSIMTEPSAETEVEVVLSEVVLRAFTGVLTENMLKIAKKSAKRAVRTRCLGVNF